MDNKKQIESTLTVGLTYDLKADYLAQGMSEEDAAEFDAVETIDGIESALKSLGYKTDRIGHIQNLVKRLHLGERWDIVFNIAEGLHGIAREAQVPALLDAYKIEYTFSGPTILTLAQHKGLVKHVLRDYKLNTADFKVIDTLDDLKDVKIPYPLFAKPVAEGTSKGIQKNSKIHNKQEMYATVEELLKHFQQSVILEKYLPGREFTVGFLGTGAESRSIGVMEVLLPKDEDIYSFHNKKMYEGRVFYQALPHGELFDRIQSLAWNVWKILGCRDAGRIDVRLDDNGDPSFMEINPLAGLNPKDSDIVILASFIGMNYVELIKNIMVSALKRLNLPQKI